MNRIWNKLAWIVLTTFVSGLPLIAQLSFGGCAQEFSLKSGTSATKVTLNFVNRTGASISVYWINFAGARVLYQVVPANTSLVQDTFTAHIWLVTDNNGKCLGTYVAQGSDTILVTLPDAFSVTPPELSFSGFRDGPVDTKFVVAGENAPGQAFSATVSVAPQDAPWLKISLLANTPVYQTSLQSVTPRAVEVRVDPATLATGLHVGTIKFEVPGGASQIVNVSFTISPNKPPFLVVQPTSLTVNTLTGQGTKNTYLQLTNTGSGTLGPLRVSTSSDQSLLQISTSASTVSVAANQPPVLLTISVSSVLPGTHNGKVTLTLPDNSVAAEIPIVQQAFPPEFEISPQAFVTSGTVDPSEDPAPTNNKPHLPIITRLTVQNLYGPPGEFRAFSDVSWLKVSPEVGSITTQTTVEVIADPIGLQPGGYYGQVYVVPFSRTTPQPSESVDVVFQVAPPLTPLKNLIDPYGHENAILVYGLTTSYNLSVKGKQVLSELITATVNYRGGPAFFTVTPSTGAASYFATATFSVKLAETAFPPGVYFGDLVIQRGGEPVETRTVVGVYPPVSGSSPRIGDRGATACAPTRLVPNVAAPWQNYSVYRGWPTVLAIDVVDDCGNLNNASSVNLSFSNGDSPMSMNNLGGGRWIATWTAENLSDSMLITAKATSLDGKLTGIALLGGSVLTSATPIPTIFTGGVVNAASFAAGAPLAPGSFVSLFGAALADKPASAPSVPLPLNLAGASVQIGGKDAPIYYASDGQINAIVPYGLAVDRPQSVKVKHGGAVSVQRLMSLSPAAPGIFSYGDRRGIIVGFKSDGSSALVDPSHPVSAQQVVVAYCTGLGEVDPAVPTGAPTPLSPLSKAANAVSMTIGGVPANVSFAGLTPGSTGLYQVNATVPAGIRRGDQVPVILQQAGQSSAPVYISVR